MTQVLLKPGLKRSVIPPKIHVKTHAFVFEYVFSDFTAPIPMLNVYFSIVSCRGNFKP